MPRNKGKTKDKESSKCSKQQQDKQLKRKSTESTANNLEKPKENPNDRSTPLAKKSKEEIRNCKKDLMTLFSKEPESNNDKKKGANNNATTIEDASNEQNTKNSSDEKQKTPNINKDVLNKKLPNSGNKQEKKLKELEEMQTVQEMMMDIDPNGQMFGL